MVLLNESMSETDCRYGNAIQVTILAAKQNKVDVQESDVMVT
jgi:hypothetical protein